MFFSKLIIDDLEVKKDLKIVFMGTPKFAVPILEMLISFLEVNYKLCVTVIC